MAGTCPAACGLVVARGAFDHLDRTNDGAISDELPISTDRRGRLRDTGERIPRLVDRHQGCVRRTVWDRAAGGLAGIADICRPGVYWSRRAEEVCSLRDKNNEAVVRADRSGVAEAVAVGCTPDGTG